MSDMSDIIESINRNLNGLKDAGFILGAKQALTEDSDPGCLD